MKKTFLRFALLFSVVLLVISGAVQAQAPAKTFCGDLAAADCTLLMDSEATMKALDSERFDLDMSLGLSGLPNMSEPLNIKLTGSGAFAVDQTAMPDVTKLDPTTLAKDQKALLNLISEAIPAIAADVQLQLDLPASLGKELGDSTLPQTIKLSVKMVDGVAYVNVGELGEAFPQLEGAKGWMGMNLSDLITAIMKQPEFGSSMGSMNSGMNMGTDIAGSFSDPATLAKFVTIERLPDGEVGSVKVAVFKTTLDYAAMFDLPEIQDLMKQQMEATGSKMSEKDMSAAMLMIRGLAQDMEFNVTQNIGLDDHYLYQTNMNMKFDFSSMKAQMGGAFVMTMSATITQSDFNDAPAVTAPEGALVIPVESVIPSKK